MMGNAIVLGSRPGSRNIGDLIARRLRARSWIVTEDDCYNELENVGIGSYQPPSYSLEMYDACIITLGHTRLTPMREASGEDIQAVLYGSLTLPLECARRYIQARDRGRIIFIGSYAHDHALTGCAAYCAAKAGLAAAVQELGWELTPDFITHIVHPYHVPSTPMGKEVLDGLMENRGFSAEAAKAYQKKDLKLERHLRPQDIAQVVHWLLAQPHTTAWLSGQGINLYGGVR